MHRPLRSNVFSTDSLEDGEATLRDAPWRRLSAADKTSMLTELRRLEETAKVCNCTYRQLTTMCYRSDPEGTKPEFALDPRTYLLMYICTPPVLPGNTPAFYAD